MSLPTVVPTSPSAARSRGAVVGLALLLVLLCSACERPFAEALPPDVRVVAPDLSTVLTADSARVQVEASSSRTVSRVLINGREMTFNADLGVWERTISLPPGATPLILTSEDRDGTAGRDTAFAVRLPHRTLSGPRLPDPRAGHTATRLLDGDVLVTGGVSSINTAARTNMYMLPRGGGAFQPHGNLLAGRVGHTASLLPDGRVLILGGSRRYNPATTGDLVESVEIYDPITGSIAPVRFSGEPIRRMHHTAVVRQENGDVLIDLYGGRGDIRYGADPRLGIRGDLRTFRLSGDSLEALNRLDTASFLVPALGHVQASTRTLDPGELGRYVVAGTTYGTQSVDTVSFMLDYTAPQGINFDDSVPSMRLSRAFAAAATLGQRAGFILVFGGTQGSSGSALGQPEVYADDARRFVRFPESTTLFRRFDHSATFTGSNRILLVGGFSPSGNALSVGEFFETSL